jgi:NAD(P)-dependent dehydrogenase (short-subunit alcohol dehydrogenase family)
MLLDGRRAILAGVGPGLGREIANELTRAGADVLLVSRRQESLDVVTPEMEHGRRVVRMRGDLTSRVDCDAVVARAVKELGGIDIVVYNAFSAGEVAAFADVDLAEWWRLMDVNLFGALELCQAALPALREQESSIVLVNSRQIRSLGQSRGGYAVSKAALHMAARVLATELGPEGIRVNTVVPGWMWGESVAGYFDSVERDQGVPVADQIDAVASNFALRYIPPSSEVAPAVVFLASDQARAITGQALDVNAGESFH